MGQLYEPETKPLTELQMKWFRRGYYLFCVGSIIWTLITWNPRFWIIQLGFMIFISVMMAAVAIHESTRRAAAAPPAQHPSLPPPRRWQWHASRRTRTMRKITTILALLASVASLGNWPVLAQVPPQAPPSAGFLLTPDIVAPPPPRGQIYAREHQMYAQVNGGIPVHTGSFRTWQDCLNTVAILYRIGDIHQSGRRADIKLDSGFVPLPVADGEVFGVQFREARFYRITLPAHNNTPAVVVSCMPR